MRKKITLILFGLFLSMGLALAQNKITGTVLEDTGEPCIGATVMIQGTKQGTKTDLDGHFTIDKRTCWKKACDKLCGYDHTNGKGHRWHEGNASAGCSDPWRGCGSRYDEAGQALVYRCIVED